MKKRTLSELKSDAHQCFDIFWRSNYEHRSHSYAWMARRIGKEHIAELNIEECVVFIAMCEHRKHHMGLSLTIQKEKPQWMEKRIKNRREMALILANRFCDIEDLFSQS